MALRLFLFSILTLTLGCAATSEQTGSCSSVQTSADINVTPSSRVVASGKVAQYFFSRGELLLKRVMIKAITNGLSSMTIKIAKGNPYENVEQAQVLTSFTTTSGLTSTSLQEVWFDLPTPLQLDHITSSDYYLVIFEGTGSITVDYSATTSSPMIRWEYREYNGAFWVGDNQDSEGISIGIAGDVACSL